MAILEEGKTADHIARATRFAFLIDADAYFRAFASAVMQARHWVGALAWDVDSRVRLGAGGWTHALPDRLGPFLNSVVRSREELNVHLLSWAPAAIYAFEREIGVRVKLGWSTHERLHFDLDNSHAPTACHHQKVVVIDDVMGFAGGVDLTSHRWDTPAHDPDDERRVTTRGRPYGPFHDVQAAVSGPAARRLGELVRERWRRHTGDELAPPPPLEEVWPSGLPVDASDVDVGLIYTDPERTRRCTEAVLVRAIESAREHVYIENQYLTSRALSEALTARLSERGGPEVFIVAPRRCEGWLEESTMGVLRAEMLAELSAADREGRLRAVYPRVRGLPVFVHSKLMIVDGTFSYVGSANFTDRSLGFDTECGVAIEAGDRDDVRHAIERFRDRLLGEHLGASPEAISRHLATGGKLRELTDHFGRGDRRVEPLEDLHGTPAFEWAASIIPLGRPFVDPPEPMELGHAITEMLERLDNGRADDGEEERLARGSHDGGKDERLSLVQRAGPRHPRNWRLMALQSLPLLLLAVVGLALWFATPLRDLGMEDVERWLVTWRERPLAFLLVLAAYAAGAVLMAPLNLLQVPVIVAFGPWLGPLYAISGAMLSASISYGIGRLVGRRPVAKLGGEDVQRAASELSGSGVLAVAIARHVPVAPYPVVNLIAGALQVRFFAYFFGTLLGVLPGTIVLAILGKGLWELLEEGATPTTVSLLIFAGVTALASAWFIRRWLQRRMTSSEKEDAG